MEFCHQCGSQKVFTSIDKSGKKIFICPNCDKDNQTH
jgi:DNA-directed RNA polymerase subunit M/transcription elongation factor TFIIS